MDYEKVLPVWEITGICSMGCKHCGSSYHKKLEGELTTEEALNLCDQIGELGIKRLIISGGEPTERKDYFLIAKRLKARGINLGILTNGWNLNQEIINKMLEIGINRVGISIDGLKETHDYMRRKGSYKRIMNALDLLQRTNIKAIVPTTINNKNIKELKLLKEILKSKGVKEWQLQLGLPMGNFKSWKHLIIGPEEMKEVISFAYETSKAEKDLIIYLGDCFGYYSFERLEIRKINYGKIYNDDLSRKNFIWQGCGAGKNTFAILPNGDIIACVSMRDSKKDFIEGNVKNNTLKEILEAPDSFSWIQEMESDKLKGFCKKCRYNRECLGGCPNPRILIGGNIFSENKYCTYNYDFKQAQKKIAEVNDVNELVYKGRLLFEKGKFQLAELMITRVLEYEPDNIKHLNLYANINLKLENYDIAKKTYKKVLEKNVNDINAKKGMESVINKIGKEDEKSNYS